MWWADLLGGVAVAQVVGFMLAPKLYGTVLRVQWNRFMEGWNYGA